MNRTSVRAGDIVLCGSTGSGIISGLIRRVTRSEFSHAQLVLMDGFAEDESFSVLEVGWRIRISRQKELARDSYIVFRPRMFGVNPSPELASRVAQNTRKLIAFLPSRRYPWWKLILYLIPWRRAQGRLIARGPRQVCSVMAIRPWVAAGLVFWVRSGESLERVDTHKEVRTVTPADIERNATRERWDVVYRTPNAPGYGSST